MAKFTFFRDVAGQYRWRLIAGNGEQIANSEAYTQYAHAVRSAKRIKELASLATVED